MPPNRSVTGAREWVAQLVCGTRLTYESRSFTPSTGELVPCRRHGYCRVDGVVAVRPSVPTESPRARPRTERELVQYVQDSPGLTLSSLRRHRFTLRLVQAAERSGAIVVDERSGRVVAAA